MNNKKEASHVIDICNSAHTAIGVYVEDATDSSSVEGIDYRPLIEKIFRASDNEILYTHSHGLHCGSTWKDAKGRVLEYFEVPVVTAIVRFYEMFGGAEYCDLRA